MGALNVNSFGGQLFGVNKRDLPDNGAQSATNMQARVNSFAPLNEDGTPFNLAAVGSGAIGLGTISSGTEVRTMFRYPFRDTGATTILGSGKVLSVVKGQLVNDTRERCYLADDGSVGSQLPPYVIHGGASPTARLLGVPAPNTELGYTVNAVAQLTAEHLANLQTVNETLILQNLEVMLQQTWGGTAASGTTPGYMDNSAASDAAATGFNMKGDKPNQSRVFGIDGSGITFSALGNEFFTWALGVPFTTHTWSASNDTALSASSPTGWGSLASSVATSGNFAAFTYKAFYPVYSLGGAGYAAARAAILALTQPGVTPTAYILTDPQVTELETRVTDLFEVTNPNIAALIARINFRYLFLTQLMDGKIGSTALANLNTYLLTAAVQAKIDNAYNAFAAAVWEKMNKAYTTPANATTTYAGTVYPYSAVYSTDRATSLPLIIAAVKARMTSDGTSAVSPYISIRPITKAKAFLDQDKLGLYQFASAGVQDAVFQASLTLDFTAELYALYTATTLEAMNGPDVPALFVQGGETTAAAVIGARDLLELEIGNLETYYAGLPNVIRATVKAYLKEIGVSDLHGEVDPTGAQVLDTRYYTWTYVNDWGEESQDWAHAQGAVPTAIEVDQNDTVTLTRTGTVPTAYGTIAGWRVYRSNTAGDTRYQLVNGDNALGYTAIATTTFTDDLKADRLQETLSTEAWSLPPTETVSGTVTYLQGMVNMPNNFLAGFIDSTAYFSEIGAPYAWPIEYAMPMAHKIIGMEVFGQTVVFLTQGGPYYVTGSDPSSMSKDDPQSNEICVSKRSIAKVGGGVVFASSKGLCIANGSGVQLFMPAPLGKQFWDVLRPDLMQIVEHDGVLYIAYGAYVNTSPTGNWQNLIAIHLASMKVTVLDTKVTALYVDFTTGSMYVALPHAGSVPQATKAFSALTYRTATWRSKRITLPQEESFAWLQVMGEQSTTSGYGATVKLYGYLTKADGTEVSTELANFTITNINPVRVRAGRFLEFEIEVSSKAQIKNVIFAGEVEDLQGVA